MTPSSRSLALALFVASVPLSSAANADDTYILTSEEAGDANIGVDALTADNPLVVVCKADPIRCRELLSQRMDQLRRLLEEERAATRRGAVPKLTEAAALAETLSTPSASQASAEAPGASVQAATTAASRLAWLAHRHRWSHPIPTPLRAAVSKAWASSYLTPAHRRILADAAMTMGHADALDHLVGRLESPTAAPPANPDPATSPPPAWLLIRHTDAPRRTSDPTALAAWFGAHRSDLRFDAFLRRWRVADLAD